MGRLMVTISAEVTKEKYAEIKTKLAGMKGKR